MVQVSSSREIGPKRYCMSCNRMYFSKLACGTCWEAKSVKLSVKACFCILGERAGKDEVETVMKRPAKRRKKA